MRPGGFGLLAVVMVPVLVAGSLAWIVLFGAASAAATCGPVTASPVDASQIPMDARVAGFDRAQLVNAAAIVNAAAAMGLGGAGQVLGVQTAIGESTLVVLDHGDGAINPDGSVADSIGLFQQQSSWGTSAQRLDPTTSAQLFFTRLKTIPGWSRMVPTLAINAVQGNADPYYYTPFAGPAAAVVAYLAGLSQAPLRSPVPTGTAATASSIASPDCGALPSGNAAALAERLMSEIRTGRLVELEPAYQDEIANVAAGTASVDCGLDPRTLQLIQLALDTFATVGISDLNRRCTGSLDGAGTSSSHWINGGGQAVDFYMLDGTPLTGGNPLDLQLLHLLDAVVPAGARAGQVECRPATQLWHFAQFDDTCNHQHIDLAYTNGAPLTTATAAAGGVSVRLRRCLGDTRLAMSR